jgi:acyl-CoA synthetase (AMP-forming)/AMP-acid ligase II
MRPATTTAPPAFAAALSGFGSRPALLGAQGTVTYVQLAERVHERAAEFGSARRLVMIRGGNDPETLISYLAALQGGHVAWLAAGEGLGSPVPWLEPDLIASHGPGGRGVIELGQGSAYDLHPELGLLLSTSGSTGSPRLVRLSHRNLQANAEAIARCLGITASERAATSLPMHYCYGLSVVNSHLLRGAALLLTDRSVSDPGFWELMRGGGGTSFAGVPHTFELLERVGFAAMELPSLRYVTQAGGRLAPERVRLIAGLAVRRGWRFIVMYGQTEATARMTHLPSQLARTHPASVGVPVPGGAIEIRPVPEADGPGVGEIVYRGPNVMLGYAEDRRDLSLGRTVWELCTGDLGRWGPTGLLEVVGRRSRFLKLFGLRVDLDQVERILEREGVRAACGGTDERMVVAVTGDGAPPGTARMLVRHLGLPPGSIEVVDLPELPLLPGGKTDYAELGVLASLPSGRSESPDQGVTELFREILDCDSVKDDDTFATLGGDSLSYVEMSLALEAHLGRLPGGWSDMSVAQLSAVGRRPGRGARVETNVVLRAAAVCLVVAAHMTAFWPAGGAHLLLALAGHSFARFQLGASESPRRLSRSIAGIARIAVPTSAWIALQMLLVGGYSLGAVLLVNDYTGDPSLTGGRWHYWFLEALTQILIVLTVILCIPAVRRLERRNGFALALALLALSLVFRLDLPGIGADERLAFRPHTVAWVFLLGWAAHRATTPRRRAIVTVLAIACVPGFFGDPVREAVVLGGLLLLVWVPVILMPKRAGRAIGLVAAASMYIYLTHWQLWPPLTTAMPIEVALPVTIAGGIVAWMVASRLTALTRGALRAWSRPSRAWLPGLGSQQGLRRAAAGVDQR